MRENETRLFTLRPEPDERNGTTAIRSNRRDHQLFEKPVNRSIHAGNAFFSPPRTLIRCKLLRMETGRIGRVQ